MRSRNAITGVGDAEGVKTPPDEKDAPAAAEGAARAIPEKNPATVELAVAKKWRCLNPSLVICVDAAGAECLLRVPARTRDNFRLALAAGGPMLVRATLVAGNLYTLAGAAPRYPGRW